MRIAKFWKKREALELPIEHRIRAAHLQYGLGMGIMGALGMAALLTSFELGNSVTLGMVAAPAISGVMVGGLLMASARRRNNRLMAEQQGEMARKDDVQAFLREYHEELNRES